MHARPLARQAHLRAALGAAEQLAAQHSTGRGLLLRGRRHPSGLAPLLAIPLHAASHPVMGRTASIAPQAPPSPTLIPAIPLLPLPAWHPACTRMCHTCRPPTLRACRCCACCTCCTAAWLPRRPSSSRRAVRGRAGPHRTQQRVHRLGPAARQQRRRPGGLLLLLRGLLAARPQQPAHALQCSRQVSGGGCAPAHPIRAPARPAPHACPPRTARPRGWHLLVAT